MILKKLKYHKKIHIGYIIMVLVINTIYLFLEVEKNKYGTLFYEKVFKISLLTNEDNPRRSKKAY